MPKLQIYTAKNYPFPNGIVSVSGLKPGTLNQSLQNNKMSPATLKAGRRAASPSQKHKSFRCCNIGVFFLFLLGGQGVSARVQPQCGFTNIPLQKFETSVGAGKVTVVEVEEIVQAGELDPDHIHTPGIYINRIIKGDGYSRSIENLTVRENELE